MNDLSSDLKGWFSLYPFSYPDFHSGYVQCATTKKLDEETILKITFMSFDTFKQIYISRFCSDLVLTTRYE